MSAFRSTGSRLSPTGLPVSFFTSFIGSSDSGRASITGLYTSIPFSSIRSAPKALASSLFVTSPVTLLLPATFSDNTVLPSLALIAFFKSWPNILLKSLVKQLNNLFPICSSSNFNFIFKYFYFSLSLYPTFFILSKKILIINLIFFILFIFILVDFFLYLKYNYKKAKIYLCFSFK